MARARGTDRVPAAELAFQQRMLPRVSRTFALTIPQLPAPLDLEVANAYLLFRIADTVEDDAALDDEVKRKLLDQLARVISDPAAGYAFARSAGDALTRSTPAPERELVASTARVADITRSFPEPDRTAIDNCLRQMCSGMRQYVGRTQLGLTDLRDVDRYCHAVAGVVGEMLTELFCNARQTLYPHREQLRRLAGRFGRGLQLTNILKDVWDDLAEGRCWLPRDRFERAGCDIDRLAPDRDRAEFDAVLPELVGIAHLQLRDGVKYTLLVPPSERGIRRFCTWSLGLAMLTLRRIQATPGYRNGAAVKVPRSAVQSVVAEEHAAGHDDTALQRLFDAWAEGLPIAQDTGA